MPRFSSILLPFLVNQTQKHKPISSKNTNTNPAIDLSCQPNTLKHTHTHTHTHTYPKISKNTNKNPLIHLQQQPNNPSLTRFSYFLKPNTKSQRSTIQKPTIRNSTQTNDPKSPNPPHPYPQALILHRSSNQSQPFNLLLLFYCKEPRPKLLKL